MLDDVLRGYAAASTELISRYEAISSAQLYAPVADLFPVSPSRILDIGAGTGRDAAWLASKGHEVIAVEPVDEFRLAGMALHGSSRIRWLNDRLPHLLGLQGADCFDRVLLSAVWQHLDDDYQRRLAMRRLRNLTATGGLVIMSLRHGCGALTRRTHPVPPEDTIDAAGLVGFELVARRHAESLQAANRAAGVRWTWLAFVLKPARHDHVGNLDAYGRTAGWLRRIRSRYGTSNSRPAD